MQETNRGKRCLSCLFLVLMLVLFQNDAVFAADRDDETPPVLYAVAVGSATAHPGDQVLVSASAEDDDSGVQLITVRFQHTVSGGVLTADLRINSDENTDLPYSGLLKIPQDAAPGIWEVTGVTLSDWEENQVRYMRGGQQALTVNMQASFTVIDAAAGVPPAPLTCQTQATSSGISIQFTASAGSADIDQVTLLFENDHNHHKLLFTLDQENLQDGVYRGAFAISPHEPTGVFSLQKVTIKSVGGNKTIYTCRDDEGKQPLALSASFVVQSDSDDLEAPILRSVTIGQPAWSGDEARARLTVNALDALSGIDHITVKFKHITTGSKASKVLRSSDSADGQTFTGELVLGEDDPPGGWRLDSVTLADRSGNRNIYCHPDDLNDRKLVLPEILTFQLEHPQE